MTLIGEYVNFNARVQSVESVNDSIDPAFFPYDILPELNLDLRPYELGLFEGGIKTSFTTFEHDDPGRTTGSRARINPYVEVPFEKLYGYITPKVSLYDISYSLDNSDQNNSPSASIPVFSVDGTLIFERLFETGGKPYYQTLEPRIFYVNIPEEEEQNQFPVFDTGESEASSFGQFFRENRFFGGDRVGDTEQVTVGLTSRIINDDSGAQRFKLSLGQIYYLKDRLIRLNPDAEPVTSSSSDFIAELTANLGLDWSITGFASWNPSDNELGSLRLAADYYHSARRNASIAYTEQFNSTQQINVGFDTPLSSHWQLNIDSAYSIEEDDLRSASFGISYDGCCWAVRLKAQRYLDGTGVFKDRFLVTLELDDLGRVGSNF